MQDEYIIIGAGAAGLFLGALTSAEGNGVILEAGSEPGRKILLKGLSSRRIFRDKYTAAFQHLIPVNDFPCKAAQAAHDYSSSMIVATSFYHIMVVFARFFFVHSAQQINQ